MYDECTGAAQNELRDISKFNFEVCGFWCVVVQLRTILAVPVVSSSIQ